jgi:hypothetical protein
MGRLGTIGCVVAVALAVDSARAQSPGLSGTWTVIAPAREAGAAQGSSPPTLSAHGDMGSGWGSPLTLRLDAASLTVEYSYFHARDNQAPFRLEYLLNGAESRNTLNLGRGPQLQVSRAVWQGERLVITTTHQFVNPRDGRPMTSETRQSLWLDAADTLLIESFRGGVLGGRSSTTRTRYKR